MGNYKQFEVLKKSAVEQIAADLQSTVEQQTQQQIDALESSVKAALNSSGWFVVGNFADGFTFTSENQVGRDSSGNHWSYNGSLPFTVSAGTTPSEPNYTNRGDAALRSEMAAEDSEVLIAGRPAKEITDTATAEAFVRLRMKLMAMGRTVLQATDLVSLTLDDPNADNTPALNTLANRSTARNEIIEFPAGEIYCDDVKIQDFMYWRGKPNTVFKQVAKTFTDNDRLARVMEAKSKRGFVLDTFVIDANRDAHDTSQLTLGTANIEGLECDNSGEYLVYRVESRNVIADAFDADGIPVTDDGGVFYQCVAKDCGKDGFHNSAGSRGNVYIDCVAIRCAGGRGGFTQSSLSNGGHVFINPTSVDCRFAFGIQPANGQTAVLINPTAFNCENIGDLSGVGIGAKSTDDVVQPEVFDGFRIQATKSNDISTSKTVQIFATSDFVNKEFYVVLGKYGQTSRIVGDLYVSRRTNAFSLATLRGLFSIDCVLPGEPNPTMSHVNFEAKSTAPNGSSLPQTIAFYTADINGEKHLLARLTRSDGGAHSQYVWFDGLYTDESPVFDVYTDDSEFSNLQLATDDGDIDHVERDLFADKFNQMFDVDFGKVEKGRTFIDLRGIQRDSVIGGGIHVDHEILYNNTSTNINVRIPLCRIDPNIQNKSRTAGSFYLSRISASTSAQRDATITVDAFWDVTNEEFVISAFSTGFSDVDFLIGEKDGETWLVLAPQDTQFRYVSFSGLRREDGIHGKVLEAGDFDTLVNHASSSVDVTLRPVRFLTGFVDSTA